MRVIQLGCVLVMMESIKWANIVGVGWVVGRRASIQVRGQNILSFHHEVISLKT